MSDLRTAVEDYLAMRRGFGFKLEGLAKLLRSFVQYCEANDVDRLTVEVAVAWATSTIKIEGHQALFARRLDAVRIFARHQHAIDPAVEVPPDDLLDHRYRYHPPRLLSDGQVQAMMEATESLTPGFRADTWRTVIGLLAVTGMRPGEVFRLKIQDIDLVDGVIQIVMTKFNKSRIVFLHPSTIIAMSEYRRVRDQWMNTHGKTSDAFFVNLNGGPITTGSTNRTVHTILTTAGITSSGQVPARLHDLRHRFVVTTMLGWYREGLDVEQRLPHLSTWLGHVDPASTYWYLHAVPELLELAANRLEPTPASKAAS
jgi:integrase